MDFRRFVVVIAVLLDMVGFTMIFVDIPLRAEDLGGSGWQIGAILASSFIVQLLVSPWWGRKSDQLGRKSTFVITTAISAISMLIYAYSGTLWLLLLSRMMSGLGSANVAIAQASMADDHEGKSRVVWLGRLSAALSVGMIAGPAIGGFIASNLGSQVLGLIGFSCSISGAALVWVFAELRGRQPVKTQPGIRFTAILRDFPKLAPFVTLSVIAWFALACLEGTFARLLRANWNYGQQEFGVIFGFESLIGFLVQAVLLAWILKFISERRLLFFGYLMQGIGLGLTPFAPGFAVILLLSSIYALGTGAASPTINSLASSAVPEDRQGELFGMLQSTRAVGFIIGPILGNALFDIAPGAPYFFAGLVSVMAALLVIKIAPQSSTAS